MPQEEIAAENYQDYSQQYPQNEGASDSILRLMIEVEETINKFEMETLRRKRIFIDRKNKVKKWVPMAEGIRPICNELGIAEILGKLRGRATTIGRLTKKTDDEIMSDMFQFNRSLIELFQLRADDWELEEELAKPLLDSCVDLIEDIVFSSRGGFTAINVKAQYHRQETASIAPDQERGIKSILGLKT